MWCVGCVSPRIFSIFGVHSLPLLPNPAQRAGDTIFSLLGITLELLSHLAMLQPVPPCSHVLTDIVDAYARARYFSPAFTYLRTGRVTTLLR